MADSLNKEIAQTTREMDRLQKSVEGLVGKLSQVGNAAGNAGKSAGGAVPGGNMMPGALGNMPAMPNYQGGGGGGFMSRVGGAALAAIPGIGQMVKGAVVGGYNMMPDFGKTLSRETSYYNSGVMQGVNGRVMRTATFGAMQGGMTSAGSDAATAEYLSNRGMAFSSNPNSSYMQTVRSVSNAAKYLNMSNDRATAAVENLTSGSTSRSLLQNTGIYTSDLATGKVKTQGQIFGELADRLTAGRGKVSADQVNESFRRGNLGASLSGLGLSDDQQQMFKQYMIEKANGNNMDLSSDSAMAELQKKAGITGNNNPALAGYQSNTFDTAAMNKAADAYIKGMNDAIPTMKALSDVSGDLAEKFGAMKGFLETLMGNNAGGAAVTAAGDILGGGISAVGGLAAGFFGGSMLKSAGDLLGNVFGKGKGGGATAARGAGSTASTAARGAQAAAAGAKTAASAAQLLRIPAAGLAGVAFTGMGGYLDKDSPEVQKIMQKYPGVTPTSARQALDQGGDNFWAKVGNLFSGHGWTTNSAGGGEASTISNNGPTGSAASPGKVSYTKPINAPMGDKYGPRTPEKTSGGTSSSFHHGIDFPAPEGTPIVASADGTVVSAGMNGGFGNCVKIKHADGNTTWYAHQSRMATSPGKRVKQGQVIGYVGTTGTSTGNHLHFAITDKSGNFFDPMKVLGGSGYVSTGSAGAGNATTSNNATSGGGASAPDINGIIDARAKAPAGGAVASLGGAVSGAGTLAGSGSAVNTLSGAGNGNGIGMGGTNVLTNNRMGIALPGVRGAKNGDPHVANDGPVNVHAGEAILTSEQADVWRSAIAGGGLGKKGNNVTINLTIGQASEAEAKKFAQLVKTYLDEDSMIKTMGRK